MQHSHAEKTNYLPLFVIIGAILIGTFSIGCRLASWISIMEIFMGLFFLVFSMLKFFDIKGFAAGFSSYDLLASKTLVYGYIYPFIELFLGVCFLSGYAGHSIYIFTAALMFFSLLGVIKTISLKKNVSCACLGTFIKVPLSTITIAEDLIMMIMSLLMLFLS